MKQPFTSATITKKREQLSVLYETLSPGEQVLVQFCSIAMEPMSMTTVIRCFDVTGIPFNGTGRSSWQNLQPPLKRILKLGLVDEHYQCPEGFREIATRRAVADGHFEKMARTIQRLMPGNRYLSRYSPEYDWKRVLRDFRIAFYRHDSREVKALYDQILRYCPVSYRTPDPFLHICNAPFDPAWFTTLPLDLRSAALSRILFQSLIFLEPDEAPLNDALTLAFGEKSQGYGGRPLLHVLTLRLLLGGRLDEARQLLAKLGDEAEGSTDGLQGCLFFLEGKNDEAIAAYEAELRHLARRTGIRNNFFTDPAGLFFLLALLKAYAGQPDRGIAAKLKKYLYLTTHRNNPNNFYIISLTALRRIAAALLMEPEYPDYDALVERTDLSFVFSALGEFWQKRRLGTKSIASLQALFQQARANGMFWTAMECAGLLAASGVNAPLYQQQAEEISAATGMISLIPSIHFEETWQKSLRALTQTAATERPVATSTEKRLIWLFRHGEEGLSLKPLEQRHKARGGWTSGRPVALSRLHKGTNLEYLSRQDHMIRATLKAESRYYGGYSSAEYYFEWEKTLPLLVGHPLIVSEDNPEKPVEFLRGEVELMVTESPEGFRLRLSVPSSEARVTMIPESPTRFKICELSDAHRRIGQILGSKGLTVPATAKNELMQAMTELSTLVTIHSTIGGSAESLEEIQGDPRPVVQLVPMGEGFHVELLVQPFGSGGTRLKPGKGMEHVMADMEGKRMLARRDLALEIRKVKILEDSCPTLALVLNNRGQGYLETAEDCLEVLLELKTLQEQGEVVVEWPEGESLKTPQSVSFDALRLKARKSGEWFELDGRLELDEGLIMNMKTLLELVETSPRRFLPLGEGRFVALTEALRRRLEEVNAYTDKRTKAVRCHALAIPVLDDLFDDFTQVSRDASWKERVKAFEKGMALAPVVPSTLQAELRDYQVAGYEWMVRLSSWGAGACLADDMGLGKTLQALAVLLKRAPQGPTLVVAPTSVCMNWLAEIGRFAPTLNPILFGGRNREERIGKLQGMDVLISSYGLLQQEAELLATVQWRTIILDEAQAIKNFETQRAQAALALKGDFRLITTGTPIENHLGEFYTLFDFINPGLLGSRQQFNERYAIPIEKNGDREARKQLKKLISPFLLRRIKSQVLDELPPRTEVTLQVEMSPEEMALYETMRREAVETLEGDDSPLGQKHLKILAEIMRLRQACCHPRLVLPDSALTSSKLTLFGEVVEELLENSHKALVFSQFVGHLSLIQNYLKGKGIEYRYLDGSTPPKERRREVEAFQAGQGSLFLISLRAGGVGLNLTAADYVIHMDPWWNPAVEDQASDRAHRIGQQRPVTVYRLVTKNTIEEKILKLHGTKRDLANSLLDGSDMSGRMSAEELLSLIREG
ncbi:MAG: ATP-dependent helicase HepA [Syntrophus sp. PtaU1.Bin208]|nr:MAG: ATP-dependent helicase HepA [Syntrophus sp. PtaU1.Bin208]